MYLFNRRHTVAENEYLAKSIKREQNREMKNQFKIPLACVAAKKS
jgi:hypothetical protein